MTLTFDLKINRAHPWLMVSVWSFMIIGWLQSQLSSGNHFQKITMRHDLDLWPFDLKINRAHPWLMVSKCMKFHDHWLITESVIVRKLVWRTDRQTDWQTECKPIVPSGFTGGGLKTLLSSKMSNGQSDTKTPKISSITQRSRTDLGRSIGVTTATQLVWVTG